MHLAIVGLSEKGDREKAERLYQGSGLHWGFSFTDQQFV